MQAGWYTLDVTDWPKYGGTGSFDPMTTKLYSSKHPVPAKYFADREEILEYFKQAVISSSGSKPPRPDNIAILGDWGVGKTSMAIKFEDILNQLGKSMFYGQSYILNRRHAGISTSFPKR